MIESKKIQVATYVIMFTTIVTGFFVNFTYSPTPIKLLYALGIWFVFFKFPVGFVGNNDFDNIPNFLLKSILILSVIALIKTILDDTPVAHGSKWSTVFFNPECLPMLLAPCFVYFGTHEDSIYYLKKALIIFLVLGSCLIVFKKFVTPSVLWFSIAFFPYLNKKLKILVLLSLVAAVFRAFLDSETSRTTILVIGYAIFSWFFGIKKKSDRFVKIFCTLSIVLPIVYAILTLVKQDFSVFSVILDFVFDTSHNKEFSIDTRTFIFRELADDLTSNDAWIMGKGAYSHYFSHYFYIVNEGDSAVRLSCEVTMLQLLLRSGILYVIAYYGLISYAIFNCLKKSNNRFLISFAVMASGWIFVSCMSYLNGCEFKHLGFFLLLGCCLSPYWLDKTDEEISDILEQ